MNSNLTLIIKQYSSLFLLLLIGIFVTLFISTAAGVLIIFAALACILIVLLINLFGVNRFVGLVYGIVGFLGATTVLTLSYRSVEETSTYIHNYELCKGKSIRNLEDIRFIQKAYAETNGVYAKDWETLIDYAKNGTVPYVESEGSVPARRINEGERDYLIQFGLYKKGQAIDFNMTEKEAYFLSKWTNCPEDLKGFRRDTLQRSLYEMKFTNTSYVESRMKAGHGKFYADSLPFIPFTGGREKWKLETVDSLMIGEDRMPAMMVSGKIPFAKIQGTDTEALSFGTLSSPDLVGSWEEK